MGPDSPAPTREGRQSTERRRPDGAGGGLFELTDRPVVEYTLTADGPTGSRVNPAFVETFGVEEPTGLAALLSGVVVSADDVDAVLESVIDGEDHTVTVQCETTDGLDPFRVRTLPAAKTGYVVFSKAVPDGQVSVLEYLTHSLRNPLEVAIIHTEVASESESFEYLEAVRSAHDRMEAIISDAARIARQGSVVEATEPVDVGAVADAAWETAQTGAATLELDSPGTVNADERGLRVLFENLFRNAAIHATTDERAPGEDVTVTVGSAAGGFFVADDGRGIPKAEREQVLDVGYTTSEDGTGLGLAIVADIAESHAWTVTVSESAGGGTRFDFTGATRQDD